MQTPIILPDAKPTIQTSGPQVVKIDGVEYDYIPPQAVAASQVIAEMWLALGKPSDPLSETGQKLMKVIISVWEDSYPADSRIWYEERKDYQNNELTITEQVHKGTGRSLASYPKPIYDIMKKVFPMFDLANRENVLKLVKLFPMFRFANKA